MTSPDRQPDSQVSVRYIVNDIEAAIAFYSDLLGFNVVLHPAPGFAMLVKGNLRLLLNQPGTGGAGQTANDGRAPTPGGWNRIQIAVEDVADVAAHLEREGAKFRNDVVTGIGGKQILVEDPSGNLVELFEPSRG